jgi:murein DD-endopeptidase MepM/ murein hydrolase activator NlpD
VGVSERLGRARWLLVWVVAGLLVSCTGRGEKPTLIVLAPTPVVVTAVPAQAIAALPVAAPVPLVESDATVAVEQPLLTPATATPAPPTPESKGFRPQQAELLRAAALDMATPEDWRPPPVPVPLSLNPDDHYWLIRPIPSGRRNFDLEWYPYGNNVLLAGWGPYRVHHGVDFPNETGTPILAASSGTVIHAGPLPSNRDGVNYYGNTVIIRHDWQWLGQDVYTLYAHTLELFVAAGDYVQQGQLIAGVGASGEVSGPHLHLEVRVGQNHYNSTRNPMLWLAPYEGWGTLAGRFVDSRGRMIPGALITVEPLNVNVPRRVQRTYAGPAVVSDEIWQENFVVADLPAGRYRVLLSVAGETFQRHMDVQPGRTNFMVVQADFAFFPTPTPTPTVTATVSTMPADAAAATPEP